MINVILFGAGNRTEHIISALKEDVEPIMIIDNDRFKWGKKICGIVVSAPEAIRGCEYDKVVIVPLNYYAIQKQLLSMGVDKKCIVNCCHYEAVCREKGIEYYNGSNEVKGRNIVAFSHALTLSGAQNVLLTALVEYINLGYSAIVISTSDGEIRDELVRAGVSVYVISDLYSHKKLVEEYMAKACMVMINTLWLYYIVEDFELNCLRNIWWIHESINIESIDSDVFGWCLKKKVHVCAVSEIVQEAIRDVTDPNYAIDVLRFGVPKYAITRREHEKINVVVLAAIDYIKGQDVFMEAVKRLPQRVRDKAEFFVVGGGARSKDIIELSKEAGVHIVDAVSRKDVPSIYETIDILVCPSRKEAMSVVVAEAMMHGILSIVSDAAGIARYVESGVNGLTFESENYDALCNVLEFAVEDDIRREEMGSKGKHIYNRYFSMNRLSQNLCKIVTGSNSENDNNK